MEVETVIEEFHVGEQINEAHALGLSAGEIQEGGGTYGIPY